MTLRSLFFPPLARAERAWTWNRATKQWDRVPPLREMHVGVDPAAGSSKSVIQGCFVKDGKVHFVFDLDDPTPSSAEGPAPAKQQDDPVNHPKHYVRGGIECIDFILAWDLGFLAGNVVKYLVRYRWKHAERGKQLEDLKKARFYLDRLVTQVEEGETDHG